MLPEVKQEYKEWIGKVDLPEAYEKKGCRIKDTAERGSRRAKTPDAELFRTARKTALHQESCWNLAGPSFNPRAADSILSGSALRDEIEGAGLLRTKTSLRLLLHTK